MAARARKKSTGRKSQTAGGSKRARSTAARRGKVHAVMEEYKEGKLKSGKGGKGGKVKSRKQAIAIAMSEAGMSRKKKSRKKAATRR